MAMDLFRRTAQIIGQGAVEYGKSYLETPVELINDVNEVKSNIMDAGKDVGQVIANTRLALLATWDIASRKTVINCFSLALHLRYTSKKYWKLWLIQPNRNTRTATVLTE